MEKIKNENRSTSLYDRQTRPTNVESFDETQDKEWYDKHHIILIGHKQPNNYVLYILSQFNLNKTDEITLKARGDLVPRAITVACILKTNHIPDLEFDTTISSVLRDGVYGDVFVPDISIRIRRQ